MSRGIEFTCRHVQANVSSMKYTIAKVNALGRLWLKFVVSVGAQPRITGTPKDSESVIGGGDSGVGK